MNELIKVKFDDERITISARELHEFLEVKTEYKDWFPRMCEYGFEIGTDFNPLKIEQVRLEGSREVKRVLSDALITIEMAKEICMLQRNEKGKQARQYFIQLEKDWNSPEKVMARALQIADKKIKQLEFKIEQDKPFVQFAAHVSNSDNAIDMETFSKILHDKNIRIGRNRLFELLKYNKYLTKFNLPYQKYVDAGYFKVVEVPYQIGNKKFIRAKTVITGKGQIYFFNKIKDLYDVDKIKQ